MDLFSHTAEELLGFYSPGSTPVVIASGHMPPETTHAHEVAHRRLCDNTSLGTLMQAYMLALTNSSDESAQGRIHEALIESIQCCWLTQEGFAVWTQLVHGIARADETLISRILEQLPDRYREAMECYAINKEEIVSYFSPALTPEQRALLLATILETGLGIVARAAMSIPIYSAVHFTNELPSATLKLALKDTPPDGRLKHLWSIVTTKHLLRWHQTALPAFAKAAESSRLFDEVLDQLIVQLCSEAGLAYESQDLLLGDLTCVLRKLGCNRPVNYVDLRELPPRQVQKHLQQAHLVSSLSLGRVVHVKDQDNVVAQLKAGLSAVEAAIRNDTQLNSSPSCLIVAELLGSRENETMMLFHIYGERVKSPMLVRERLEELQQRTGDVGMISAKLRPNAALHFGSFRAQLPTAVIYHLPELFKAQWAWVTLIAMLGDLYDQNLLLRAGAVYVVDLVDSEWRSKEPYASHDASGSSWTAAFAGTTLLHVYRFESGDDRIILARVAAGDPGSLQMRYAGMRGTDLIESSITEVLMIGAFAEIIKEGASNI